jgi:anti-sigma-K factor RskA
MSDELHDLAPLYALDALDDLESVRFGRHLQECAKCQAAVAGLEDVLASVASTTSEAPPRALKRTILEAIGNTPQTAPRPGRRRAWYAVAAGVVVLAVVGWSMLGPSRLINAVLGDPDAITTLAAPTADGIEVFDEVRLVYSEELATAVLVFDGLDQPDEGQTYEIWLIQDGNPLPAGLFRPDESGAATVRVEGELSPGLTVAVTQEPDGGVDLPTGPPLLTAAIGA